MKGIVRVPCTCGKEKYYSEDAAQFALNRISRIKVLQESRKEVRYYPCAQEHDVWHLTSMSIEKFREQQVAYRAEQEARRNEYMNQVRRQEKLQQHLLQRHMMFRTIAWFGVRRSHTFRLDPVCWYNGPSETNPYAGKVRCILKIRRINGRSALLKIKMRGKI